MRRFVGFVLGIALLPTGAIAGGINLSWGHGCWPDEAMSTQGFACNTNIGEFSMTASFVPGRNYAGLEFFTFQLDMQTDVATLPDWWQLSSPTSCRYGSLNLSGDFNSESGSCSYVWPGQTPSTVLTWRTAAYPGVGYSSTPLPNRAQAVGGVGAAIKQPLDATIEYYAFRLTFDTQKTVGVGACGGCAVPAAFVLNEIALYGDNFEKLNTPLENTCLRWQSAGATPCSATMTRNTTWGTIKSLYR